MPERQLPRLSAIIIAKNEAAQHRRLPRQLAFCDERIVVDGGSDDGTPRDRAGRRARASRPRLAGIRRAEEFRAFARRRRLGAVDRRRRARQPGARAGDPDARSRRRTPTATRSRAARASSAARCAIRAGLPTTCCGCSAAARRASPTISCTSGSSATAGRRGSPSRCCTIRCSARGRDRAHGPLFDRRRRDAGGLRPPGSFVSGIAHGLWSFLRTYVLRLGFLDGREGFLLAVANAEGTYYRYMKAWLQGAARWLN